jgi:hypothetical protein
MLILSLVLVADWLDGATARRYHKCCRAGYMTDVVTDRVSERFVFWSIVSTPLGQVFFLLWLANLILAYYSMRSNKHTSLPLRFAYLIILIAWGRKSSPGRTIDKRSDNTFPHLALSRGERVYEAPSPLGRGLG